MLCYLYASTYVFMYIIIIFTLVFGHNSDPCPVFRSSRRSSGASKATSAPSTPSPFTPKASPSPAGQRTGERFVYRLMCRSMLFVALAMYSMVCMHPFMIRCVELFLVNIFVHFFCMHTTLKHTYSYLYIYLLYCKYKGLSGYTSSTRPI